MAKRVFVGFSSTHIRYYTLMRAWKASKGIDFDFVDCQLHRDIRSDDEAYIKRVCRERLDLAGTFIQLIGENTRYKYKYVRWEAEVALEQGMRVIGVNLNGRRTFDSLRCPPVIRDVGAVFVPFNARIIQYALEHWQMHKDGNWWYRSDLYRRLGISPVATLGSAPAPSVPLAASPRPPLGLPPLSLPPTPRPETPPWGRRRRLWP